jgi:hypothetical protein
MLRVGVKVRVKIKVRVHFKACRNIWIALTLNTP